MAPIIRDDPAIHGPEPVEHAVETARATFGSAARPALRRATSRRAAMRRSALVLGVAAAPALVGCGSGCGYRIYGGSFSVDLGHATWSVDEVQASFSADTGVTDSLGTELVELREQSLHTWSVEAVVTGEPFSVCAGTAEVGKWWISFQTIGDQLQGAGSYRGLLLSSDDTVLDELTGTPEVSLDRAQDPFVGSALLRDAIGSCTPAPLEVRVEWSFDEHAVVRDRTGSCRGWETGGVDITL